MSLPGKDGRSCANFRIEFMKFADPLNTERAPYFKGTCARLGPLARSTTTSCGPSASAMASSSGGSCKVTPSKLMPPTCSQQSRPLPP